MYLGSIIMTMDPTYLANGDHEHFPDNNLLAIYCSEYQYYAYVYSESNHVTLNICHTESVPENGSYYRLYA